MAANRPIYYIVFGTIYNSSSAPSLKEPPLQGGFSSRSNSSQSCVAWRRRLCLLPREVRGRTAKHLRGQSTRPVSVPG
jgi:hypothetical protein